jgi:F-type H+-transporting ATPase subunit epsilon
MVNKSFWLDVVTPSKKFFSGEVEEVIITTQLGKEGFMAKHSWTCKILDAGELWIRELGAAPDEWKIASAAGGFVDVKENMVIYIDAIEWDKGPDRRKTW